VITVNTMPQPMLPDQNSQTTTGSKTGNGPSCATHSTRITATNRPTRGTPASHRPTPAITVCTSAVTTTPSATPRNAWPASTSVRSPRSLPSRRANMSAPAVTPSPLA